MLFLGHLNRHKYIEHLALTGKIEVEGKKSKGRPRITYLNNLNSSVTKKEKSIISFLRVSDQREKWRTMITDVCHRPGTT